MIEPTARDVGQHVTYRAHGVTEFGVITSYNSSFVFVRYYQKVNDDGSIQARYGETSEATRREDLEWQREERRA